MGHCFVAFAWYLWSWFAPRRGGLQQCAAELKEICIDSRRTEKRSTGISTGLQDDRINSSKAALTWKYIPIIVSEKTNSIAVPVRFTLRFNQVSQPRMFLNVAKYLQAQNEGVFPVPIADATFGYVIISFSREKTLFENQIFQEFKWN